MKALAVFFLCAALVLASGLATWRPARRTAALALDRGPGANLAAQRAGLEARCQAAVAPLGVSLQAMALDPALLAALSGTASVSLATVAVLNLAASSGLPRLQVADASGRVLVDIAGGKIDVSPVPAPAGSMEEIGRRSYRTLSQPVGPAGKPLGTLRGGVELAAPLALELDAVHAAELALADRRQAWNQGLDKVFQGLILLGALLAVPFSLKLK